MNKIKSHSTVEQIAKKHRLDVSFVQRQLKMGIPIEHEHTNDKNLATDIALQHLDEIPDYYTRLKKMEKSAKNFHKKFKDVKEEKMKEKDPCWKGYQMVGNKKKGGKTVPNCVPIKEASAVRYCPRCDKNETRDECKYGERYWDMFSRPVNLGKNYTPNTPHPGNFPESFDHEHSMARSELATIASAVKRLRKKMKGEGNIEAWVQSKITKAADYLDTAADYVDSGEMKEQMLPPIDPEAHRRVQRNQKIYNKGKSTDNPHEKDTFLKKAGPQLPFAKKLKDKSVDLAHFEYDNNSIEEDASQDKFDRRVNAAMALKNNPQSKLKLLKIAAKEHPSNLKLADEYSNWRTEFGLSEDWQKVNRKDRTDGLSQKAVNAYRREHPGSKLQTAVTEKNPSGKRAKRRKSFCSRSAGQRDMHNIDCSKTPDKAICKARRRWKC